MVKFTKLVEVDLQQKQIKITISCDKRKLAVEEKAIWKGVVNDLIPDDYKDKVRLISKPSATISNLDLLQHSNTGSWVYSIIEEESSPEQPKRPSRRRSRRKTKTTSEK